MSVGRIIFFLLLWDLALLLCVVAQMTQLVQFCALSLRRLHSSEPLVQVAMGVPLLLSIVFRSLGEP